MYTAQIKRNLATRLKDHNPTSNNQKTDVTKHILDNPDHYIDFNNVTVCSTVIHWANVLIKESLFIQKSDVDFNIDKRSVQFNIFNNKLT